MNDDITTTDEWQPDPSNPIDARLIVERDRFNAGNPIRGAERERIYTDPIVWTREQAEADHEAKQAPPPASSPPPSEREWTPESLRDPNRDAEYGDKPFTGIGDDVALNRELQSIGVSLDVPRSEIVAFVGQAQANLQGPELSADEEIEKAKQTGAELRRAWGGNYDSTLSSIREVLRHHPRVREMIETSYLDLDAGFMKAFGLAVERDRIHRVGKASYRKHGHSTSLAVELRGGE